MKISVLFANTADRIGPKTFRELCRVRLKPQSASPARLRWCFVPEGAHREKKEERDQEEILSRAAISARVVYEAILVEGEEELARPTSALAFSGLAAGLSMGFSLVAQGLLQSALPASHWRELLVKLGYSAGFLIVVLGRQQLFTENTLTPVLAFLRHKSKGVFGNLMRLWIVVYLANILGAFLFAWIAARSTIFDENTRKAFAEIGSAPLELSVSTVFLRAIFAGWLIALMVWLMPFAEAARVWIIVFITYLVGLGHFTHIIAGSVDVLFLVASGELGIVEYATWFMLPTLVGNIVGGVTLVALLNHGQVTAGRTRS